MRRVALFLLVLLAAHCHRAPRKAAVRQPPFDPNAFIVSTIEMTSSDVAIAPLTAVKGRRETRRLASDIAREQRGMLAAIGAIASRRGIASPAGLPDAQVALRENLAEVDDQFDQAYVLAMMQNLDALDASLGRAAQSNDAELRQFAARFQPIVRARREDAASVLSELGGSPFRVAP